MERIMNSDERIRRAEEIYNRRRNQNLGSSYRSTHIYGNEKKRNRPLRKLIMQIIFCVIIYVSILVVKNCDYIFTQEFLNNVKSILNYNVELEKYYNKATNFFNGTDVENNQETTTNTIENENQINTQETENIGGANEEKKVEEVQNLSQMEIDANNIKGTYNLIKPLEGTITSRFGQRDPTTPTVPKNHTGIDIAANTGTDIVAALDGIVEVASSEGDYGKHFKIKKDDVCLVYAHCSELLKKQGDTVKQGEVIAKVGATGNVTGPHLHFEIRKEDRFVNPDLVLQF